MALKHNAIRDEGYNKIKCSMCDSTEWVDYQRCKVCGKYFVWAQCRNCGAIRLERCPLDGGELELLVSDETSEGEEQDA